jgi:hypothetical protein
MKKTQEAEKKGDGFLSKAGASAMGLDNAAPAEGGDFGQTGVSKNGCGTTEHWKSTYKNTVESSLAQPAQRSQPPKWSILSQAYSSKRSYFYTEAMKSFGTYGNNPLQKLKGEDATKTVLHELK